jgi:hypothetical protein
MSTEAGERYAVLRVVRRPADERDLTPPLLRVPAGCRLITEGYYAAVSPAEYYVHLAGTAANVELEITWPGHEIEAVVSHRQRLPLQREGQRIACAVPLHADTLRAARSTLEVWSHFNEPDLAIRVEHNHRDRRAGPYAAAPWNATAPDASLGFIFAAREMLRDWGLHHALAAAGLGRISLMGYESNLPLHEDAPPHWHLIFYWPGISGTQVPHLYLDNRGHIVENLATTHDRPERQILKADQPMNIVDREGQVQLVITLRRDGGIDVGPRDEPARYALVPDSGAGGFSVHVLKGGQPLSRVWARDDVDAGLLQIVREGSGGQSNSERHAYDPLTGVRR